MIGALLSFDLTTMKKPLKILGLLCTLVFFIVLCTLAGLNWWFDPNNYKDTINAQLSAALDMPTNIQGRIHWSIFPSLGIDVNDIVVGSQQKTEAYQAQVPSLQLSLQWLPLMRKQLTFRKIHLDNPSIQLFPDRIARTATVAVAPPPPAQATHSKKYTLKIHSLLIKNGRVRVQQKDGSLRITDINGHIKQLASTDNKIYFALDAKVLAEKNNDRIAFTLDSDANIQSDDLLQKLSSLQTKGMLISGQVLLKKISINALRMNAARGTMTFKEGALRIQPLQIKLYGGSSSGSLLLENNTLRITQTAKNIASEPLITALTGNPLISGDLSFDINTSIPLNAKEPLQAMVSEGTVQISKGKILGVDIKAITETLNQQIAHLWKETRIHWEESLRLLKVNPAIATSGDTPFTRAHAHYTLGNNILEAYDIQMDADAMKVLGKLSIHIAQKQLKGALSASISNLPSDSPLAKLQKSMGGGIPLNVSGTFNAPMVLPDSAVIFPILRDYLLSDVLKKQLDKPIKAIGKELKRLFN